MLSYVMVLLIAGVVGLAVYLLVLRLGMDQGSPANTGEAAPTPGLGEPPTAPSAPPPLYTQPERRASREEAYLPLAPAGPSWHSRLGGVMGLVIAVIGAALGIAAGLYLVGHVVARLLHSAAP